MGENTRGFVVVVVLFYAKYMAMARAGEGIQIRLDFWIQANIFGLFIELAYSINAE